MIRILRKGMITRHFLPYLSTAKRGYKSSVPLWEIVNAILYKLKSGVQWSLLPCKSLIRSNKIKYGAVYHHYRKWVNDGSWQRAWQAMLKMNKHFLDMSLTSLDGTHSPAKKGGEGVGYQKRKKCKTSNTLWLTDRKGNVIGFLPPLSGKHNDLYQVETGLRAQIEEWKKVGVSVDGLFMNADAGFDSKGLKAVCSEHGIFLNNPLNQRNSKVFTEEGYIFDELMYEERYTIERTNAWMDSWRSLLNRFDTSIESWTAWHSIFAVCSWCKYLLKV